MKLKLRVRGVCVNKDKILDLLLMSKQFYKKITERIITLYVGLVVVGIFNMFIILTDNFKGLFLERPLTTTIFNIGFAVTSIMLIGFMDVVFFSMPIFDFLKKLKKDKFNKTKTLIRLMKVYITANALVVPVNIFFYIIAKHKFYIDRDIFSNILEVYLLLIMPIWLSAIITRGTCVIFDFLPKYKKLVFSSILIWNLILPAAILYVTNNLLIKVFR